MYAVQEVKGIKRDVRMRGGACRAKTSRENGFFGGSMRMLNVCNMYAIISSARQVLSPPQLCIGLQIPTRNLSPSGTPYGK